MLDIRTAVVASILVDIALVATALGVHLKHRKQMEKTLHWLVAFSATLAGHGLLVLRVAIPGEFCVIVGKLFLAFGIGSAVAGAIGISGRKVPYSTLASILAVYVSLDTAFGIVFHNPQMRALITSATVAIGAVIGWACLAFPKEAARRSALSRGAGAFAALAALYACHFFFVLVLGGDEAWLRDPNRDALFFLASLAVFVGIGLGYLGMIEGLLSDELARSAEENDLLLREIRHRSKNDLALIASLVSLQAGTMSDPASRAAFDQLKDRIMTIAAVYRLLSKSEGVSRADAGDYLKAVIAGMRDGLTAGRNIGFSVEAERIELPANQLIPLGLIVNELATNAVKHAFPDGRPGNISIQLGEAESGRGRLIVRDDGIGKTEAESDTGIGLTLIDSLARQLKGKLRAQSASTGTGFVLDFPID